MATAIDETLYRDGERLEIPTDDVVLTARQHWGVFVWPVLWQIVLGWFIIPLIWPIVVFFEWQNTEVVLTKRKVTGTTGVFGKTRFDLRLDRVESIRLKTSVLGRMLGYGDLEVRGTGSTHMVFRTIADVVGVKSAIDRQIDILLHERNS